MGASNSRAHSVRGAMDARRLLALAESIEAKHISGIDAERPAGGQVGRQQANHEHQRDSPTEDDRIGRADAP